MTLAVFKRASEMLVADDVAGRGSVRLNWHRLHAGEVVYWLAAVLVFFLLPQYLAFASTVLVASIFVMSLDLILGFAGIISLGHALYFGFGAYVTGLATFIGWTEPITGHAARRRQRRRACGRQRADRAAPHRPAADHGDAGAQRHRLRSRQQADLAHRRRRRPLRHPGRAGVRHLSVEHVCADGLPLRARPGCS